MKGYLRTNVPMKEKEEDHIKLAYNILGEVITILNKFQLSLGQLLPLVERPRKMWVGVKLA
jgi:hypothetical protein